MRWGNLLLGALGLALLQGVVSKGGAASNVGGFLGSTGTAVAWFVDPAVPAFKNTGTPSTSSKPGTAVAGTASGTPGATFVSTPISPTLGQGVVV